MFTINQDCWRTVTDMNVGRASPAIASANSLLYVIGGDMASDRNDFFRTQVRQRVVQISLRDQLVHTLRRDALFST